jgi:glycerol 3-phosphatase-2
MAISPLVARYDNLLLDLDGVVWIGDRPTRRAADAISELRAAGKHLAFVTNDPCHSPEEYVRKLWSLGVQASLEEVVTVGGAIQHVLAERGPGRAYVIGSPAIFRHVADAGYRIVNHVEPATEADVLIVAGHDDFNYTELQDGMRAVLAGAEMIAAGRDRSFPGDGGLRPGSGAIVAALEYATERPARLVGKPDPQIFFTALDRLNGGRTLMVGDHLVADLKGASAAGLVAAIVLTGVASRQQATAAADPAPVAVAEDLYALVTGHGS